MKIRTKFAFQEFVSRAYVCVYVYVKSFLQTDTEVAREARCKGEERGGE